ncbi:MAG TPA: tetraacyldisaccharide 4'-kinase [Chitinophagaceae bacterium]|nr:tetraacyldisaccharide 4'-kinase [Chitinophagaceae bacterium]
MNFNFPLLKPIRILLFPFSLLYFALIYLRNRLYDKGIFKSASFNLPLICVGNIATGGTGKSPMTEYLVRELKSHFTVATLSRGYKRKTSGYALANPNSNALEIGDEPMQFHLKFPDVAIAVGEERLEAIPQLLHDRPDTQAIILDDAFQHRAVKAGMNIVLTDCNNLYTRDWYLPTGDLRDEKNSVKRAQIIIVTKCRPDLSVAEKEAITHELEPLPGQAVFFTSIRYGKPYHITSHQTVQVNADTEVLLVTGIANPAPLKSLLAERSKTYFEMAYNDHHIFTIDDLRDIKKRFASLQAEQKIILTTEKDAVRLVKFEQALDDMPLYVVPIELEFLFNDAPRFNGLIGTFIKDFKQTA